MRIACRIVALTAHAGSDEADRGKASGFDLCPTKPIGPKALRDAVFSFAAS